MFEDLMRSDERPTVYWVIYRNPSDYPGMVVLRRQASRPGWVTVDAEPLYVGRSVLEARTHVPLGLVRYRPSVMDENTIAEYWV
jgi:hypothetical protein